MPKFSAISTIGFAVLITAILLTIAAPSHASNTLLAQLQKTPEGAWKVEYKTSEPVNRIVFHNSSNGSRVKRWFPESQDFRIVYEDAEESVQRKNGRAFTNVSFELTPTYTHLPKNYAPFSPLSDGGMIFNSGRFFACINECNDKVDRWQLSLNVPKGDHIVLDGKVIKESATWLGKGSGASVYVGKQIPIEVAGTLSIIDKGLPGEIRQSLNKDIPVMMLYFEKKLGHLIGENKPSLFASYSNRPGNSSQGGTLPGQIFMHWDFDDLEEKIDNDDFLNSTLVFFAHEVAHLFQSNSSFGDNSNEAWVHEGSAEFFALDALVELYPEAQNYVKSKQAESKSQCIRGLKTASLENAAQQGKFLLHYQCGLLIHQRIQQALSENSLSESNYSIWRQYRQRLNLGELMGQATFLNVVEDHTSAAFIAKIEAFISTQHKEPDKAVETLLSH